ncbi:hypothetical protein BG000_003319 [Podila horticola]|nr:hypothetical protein BG000_003319 [Podila horticola]
MSIISLADLFCQFSRQSSSVPNSDSLDSLDSASRGRPIILRTTICQSKSSRTEFTTRCWCMLYPGDGRDLLQMRHRRHLEQGWPGPVIMADLVTFRVGQNYESPRLKDSLVLFEQPRNRTNLKALELDGFKPRDENMVEESTQRLSKAREPTYVEELDQDADAAARKPQMKQEPPLQPRLCCSSVFFPVDQTS